MDNSSGKIKASISNKFTKSSAQVQSRVTPSVSRDSGDLKVDGYKTKASSVRFRLTEIAIIKAKAQLAKVTVNAFIRAATLGSDYRPPEDPQLVAALLQLNRELTAQGNNLNQIAKQLNAGLANALQGMAMIEGPLLRALYAVAKALMPDGEQS